jgi:segregation and condensation protein B
MDELKAKVEAILFCLPEGVDLNTLARSLGIGSKGHVKSVVNSLKEDYEKRKSGLFLTEDGGLYKLKVRDEYMDIVRDAAEPEIPSAVLETLGYVAHNKRGILQSSLVKARGSDVYKHVKDLLKLGLISAEKHGVTKKLKTTKKFYEYFQLKPGSKLELPEE